MNINEFITGKKGNSISESITDNNFAGKNINININNNITNFYNMRNYSGIDDKIKIKENLTEEEIQHKLNVYRTKLNSEMLKYLNEEKVRENERQNAYENLKDNQEKFNFEKEVSKERLESSEKIIKMNQ